MASVKLKISKHQKTTSISNIFIDYYMPYAHPTYVTVYILGLRHCYSTKKELTTRNIADSLSILESDVIRAWRYWADMGILELYEDVETQQFSIEYLPVNMITQAVKPKDDKIIHNNNDEFAEKKTEKVEKAEKIKKTEETKEAVGKVHAVVMETRPTYSVQELDFYIQNNADVRKLFKSAEQYLGKLLSYNDMNLIFSFHDFLRLPMDVINILLNYCTSNNHRNMRYIEKVAVEWADKNINTVDAAKEHIKLYNNDYRIIMKSFGINNRDPVYSEIEFMNKWIKVYKMPFNLIEEACKKAVLQTGKVNFPYADTIIKRWHEKNISTLTEVSDIESAYTQKNQSGKRQHSIKNRFVNYEQRNWNFDELEQLEQNYIDKKLET